MTSLAVSWILRLFVLLHVRGLCGSTYFPPTSHLSQPFSSLLKQPASPSLRTLNACLTRPRDAHGLVAAVIAGLDEELDLLALSQAPV